MCAGGGGRWDERVPRHPLQVVFTQGQHDTENWIVGLVFIFEARARCRRGIQSPTRADRLEM